MIAGLAAAAALAAVAVVVLVGVPGSGGGGDDADAFASKPAGLQERLAEANLPVASDHFHPTLKVFVDGQQVPVPDDIGIGEGGVSAPLHKHPGDDLLHAEGLKDGELTLDQVMMIWGVPLSPERLGPHRTKGQRTVRMWVKAPGSKRFVESREFGKLRLRDAAEIYVAYGTPEQAPIAQ